MTARQKPTGPSIAILITALLLLEVSAALIGIAVLRCQAPEAGERTSTTASAAQDPEHERMHVPERGVPIVRAGEPALDAALIADARRRELEADWILRPGQRILIPRSDEPGDERLTLRLGGSGVVELRHDSMFGLDARERMQFRGAAELSSRGPLATLHSSAGCAVVVDEASRAELIAERAFCFVRVHRGRLRLIAKGEGIDVSAGQVGIWSRKEGFSPPRRFRFVPGAGNARSAFQERDGVLTIEAEHFSAQEKRGDDAWQVLENVDGAIGNAAVVGGGQPFYGEQGYHEARSELRYRIAIHEPGSYQIWIRSSCPANNRNSVFVGFDDRRLGRFDFRPRPDGGWRWDGGRNITIEKAGTHVLVLWVREPGSRIDRLVLTKRAFEPAARELPESIRR